MDIINSINLHTGTVDKKREELLIYFNNTISAEEKLYTALTSEDSYYQRADPLRHPLIFYYGHTAVFFVNKLILAKLIDQRVVPKFESIFAIGVDEMSWDDLNEKNYDWPTVEATKEYRLQVANVVRELINTLPLTLPIDWESPFWPILMGIEHLKIHIETSSVLIRQLPIEMVTPNTLGKRCTISANAPKNELINVNGGTLELGKDKNHHLYGWDNEYGKETVEVKPFKAAKYLVSNGEFLDFVKDDGYSNSKYWTEEGWAWCEYKQAKHPLFWINEKGDYALRLMDEIIPMPWDWPVEINQLEASAFCQWKSEKSNTSLRLPTEAEWQHLYEQHQLPDVDQWKEAPGNINLEHYSSPCPVNIFQTGDFYDLIGNVWQWTETPIGAYPGFKVHPLYDDFSTPTFDGQHNIFKGGSWISTGNEASKHARYAFRRHFYQHAGFRYIASDHPAEITDHNYETDEEVTRSCESNYGVNTLGLKPYYETLSELCQRYVSSPENSKILDVNCDTGRLAFELSKTNKHITALDASARFIKMAIQMQEKGSIRYTVKNEGELVYYREKQLTDIGLSPKDAQKVKFMQADAANLKSQYSAYDLIVATGLLEELYAPKAFLSYVHERLNDLGILILGSNYKWSDKTTKKEEHLGGFKKDGEPVYFFEAVSELLSPNFELINKPFDLSKVTRLSSREFNIAQEEISVWRKK